MSKFTIAERRMIQDIVSTLTIKRIPEAEIIKQVYEQTNKSITRQTIYNLRQQIKKESAKWYEELRQGQYEFLHEFKERINEIVDLQKKLHKIIDNNENNENNAAIQLAAISELHKLNITLSNYFDVAPTIVNGINTISESSQPQSESKAATRTDQDIIV